jgi:uncharacterized Zn-binding protein involved in type VI secretion
MSGLVITKSSVLNCPHSTPAKADMSSPRVKAAGQPVILQGHLYSFPTCTAGQSKCTSGSWTVGALRVKASGLPVAISTGVSVIAPPGVFSVVTVQPRVKAS